MIVDFLSAQFFENMILYLLILEEDGVIVWKFKFYVSDVIFLEHEVPFVLKQLRAILKGRGSYYAPVYANSARVTYDQYGPNLSGNSDEVRYIYNSNKDYGQINARALAEMPAKRRLEEWERAMPIFEALIMPINHCWISAIRAAKRWKVYVENCRLRKRTIKRTEAVKQELIAAAWHPRRMVAWCLDTEEREELGAIGAIGAIGA